MLGRHVQPPETVLYCTIPRSIGELLEYLSTYQSLYRQLWDQLLQSTSLQSHAFSFPEGHSHIC